MAKELEKEQGFIVTYNKDTEFVVSYDTYFELYRYQSNAACIIAHFARDFFSLPQHKIHFINTLNVLVRGPSSANNYINKSYPLEHYQGYILD